MSVDEAPPATRKSGKVIIVLGIIGSGKSTLSKELAKALGEGTLWLAEADEKGGRNPYLADYYADSKRYAFTMQMHLLGVRFQQHLYAQQHVMSTGNNAVMDSALFSDTAFSRLQLKSGLMEQREFDTYAQIYHAMTQFVLLPTACLRILTSPLVCQTRIKGRMEKETGRKCEAGIPLDYLQGLDREIDHVVSVLRAQGVIVLDVPWGANRDSKEVRQQTVEDLAERINAIVPPDLFLDLHRRTATTLV